MTKSNPTPYEEVLKEFDYMAPSRCINADKQTGEIVWVPAMRDWIATKLQESEQRGREEAAKDILEWAVKNCEFPGGPADGAWVYLGALRGSLPIPVARAQK